MITEILGTEYNSLDATAVFHRLKIFKIGYQNNISENMSIFLDIKSIYTYNENQMSYTQKTFIISYLHT